mgnify:CR=1 FL=1
MIKSHRVRLYHISHMVRKSVRQNLRQIETRDKSFGMMELQVRQN